MNITTKYDNGQIVFLVTDTEQLERMVTAIQVTESTSVSYQLSCGSTASWHYECEIATDKDILKAINK